MNPQVKALLRENNAREKGLSPQAQEKMTDIVVYLRGQDLSELAQEEIRRDIQEMVLEAEGRGETIDQVIGTDYRAFCDEIVAAVPRSSRRVRALRAVSVILPALSVLMGIWTVNKVVHTLLAGYFPLELTLTVGEVISMVAILLTGVAAVQWVCRTSLDAPKQESKGKGFLRLWALFAGVAAAILLPGLLWKTPLCTIGLFKAVLVTLLPAAIYWGLSRRKDL